MFCPKCGLQYEGAYAFCPKCGARIGAVAPAQPVQTVQTPVQQPMPTMPPVQPYYAPMPAQQPVAQGSGVAHVKRTTSSGLFLTSAILFSAYFLLTLVSMIVSLADSWEYLRYANTPAVVSLVFSFLTLIPPLLIVIGLWIIFSSAINRMQNQLSTTGFTLIRGSVITNLVLYSIALAAIAIAAIVIIANDDLRELYSLFYYFGVSGIGSSRDSALVVIMLLVVIAVLVLMIICMARLAGNLRSIRNTVRTGVAYPSDVSSFAAVFLIVLGGFVALGIVMSLVGRAVNPLSLLTNACHAAALIVTGILLMSYKRCLTAAQPQSPMGYRW